jgi:hypothetical protein
MSGNLKEVLLVGLGAVGSICEFPVECIMALTRTIVNGKSPRLVYYQKEWLSPGHSSGEEQF